MTDQDQMFMRRCLELAALGFGKTRSNPMVGAVLTVDGVPVAEGYHEFYGGPHAEVNAIANLKDPSLLSRSCLYVSLEPCCHFGKTPPCADLILKSGIPKVVVGCLDPFEKVSGHGVARLREAGVQVEVGVLEAECRALNCRFMTFHEKQRPWIILKWAETADGYIARSDGSSRWISSDQSRALVHQWRAQELGVMVGTQTALMDNPELTVRHLKGDNPTRIVIDRTLSLPPSHKLLNGEAPTLVFNEKLSKTELNLEYIKLEPYSHDLRPLLAALHQRKIISCIIEGGAKLLSSFIDQALWDEARVFKSTTTFTTGLKAPTLPANTPPPTQQQISTDTLLCYNEKR